MYQFKSRIRYSETDETGRLSVPGIINYMQDCSTFQSEDGRMGISYLKEHHRAWLLSGWRIVIDRYPKLGEEITAGTWHCGSKGFYGYRDFVLLDQENNPLVRANSLWFSMIQKKYAGAYPARRYPSLRNTAAVSGSGRSTQKDSHSGEIRNSSSCSDRPSSS